MTAEGEQFFFRALAASATVADKAMHAYGRGAAREWRGERLGTATRQPGRAPGRMTAEGEQFFFRAVAESAIVRGLEDARREELRGVSRRRVAAAARHK